MRGALLLLGILPIQDDSRLGPTPPPDRYDPTYDARLFPGEPSATEELEPQPTPIRPLEWVVYGSSDDGMIRDSLLRDVVVAGRERAPASYVGRMVRMPADAELDGSFTWATTVVESPREEVRFLRAPGAELIFVNGEGFLGDPERRGDLGVPVFLWRGENIIHVAGIRGGFELELWKPMTRMVIASWAVTVTNAFGTTPMDGPRLSSAAVLAVPVFNAALEPAEFVHFHYGRAQPVGGPRPKLPEWADGGYAVPLALSQRRSNLFDLCGDEPGSWNTVHGLAPVCAYDFTDSHADKRLLGLAVDETEKYGGNEKTTWPRPVRSMTVLLVESAGAPEVRKAAQAVARFFQQEIWYRTGALPWLVSEEWLASKQGRSARSNADLTVRFGALGSDEPGVLEVGFDAEDSHHASIRGSDAEGLRLAYLINPFFREIGSAGESWSVR